MPAKDLQLYRLSLRKGHENAAFLDVHYIMKSVLSGDEMFCMHTDSVLKDHSFINPFKLFFPKRKNKHDKQRRSNSFTAIGLV